jgi:hypothetical protein
VIASKSTIDNLTALGDSRGDASLPVALDWQEWWGHWAPRIASDVGRVGWVLFLMDAVMKLTDLEVMMSRKLRNKAADQLPGWAEDEWSNVAERAAQAVGWFEEHAPAAKRDAPEWAQFILAGIGGLFAVQARLAREVRAAQEQGYRVVTLEHLESGGLRVQGEIG